MGKFAKAVRFHRLAKALTLRAFCREAKLDPSNWSKVERGLQKPPTRDEVLQRIGDTLELSARERAMLLVLSLSEHPFLVQNGFSILLIDEE